MVATAERTLMSVSYGRTHVRGVKELLSYSEEHVVSFFLCFVFYRAILHRLGLALSLLRGLHLPSLFPLNAKSQS